MYNTRTQCFMAKWLRSEAKRRQFGILLELYGHAFVKHQKLEQMQFATSWQWIDSQNVANSSCFQYYWLRSSEMKQSENEGYLLQKENAKKMLFDPGEDLFESGLFRAVFIAGLLPQIFFTQGKL